MKSCSETQEAGAALDTASQGSKRVGTGVWVWTLQCAVGVCWGQQEASKTLVESTARDPVASD